jgi:hypothetical protein
MEKSNSNNEVPENAQDLTIFVQNLLEQMVKFYQEFVFPSLLFCT